MTADPTPPEPSPIRERILGAAFDAFMQHGYTGASTLEIARRAKVSKRDLYAQFGSKQAMLAACITSRAERMQPAVPSALSQDPAGLRMTLSAFGARLLLEVSRPEVMAVFRLAIAEAERAPEVARTLDELGRVGVHGALTALLRHARDSGSLAPEDPAAMANAFVALLWSGGLMQRLLLRVAPPPDEAEAKRRAGAAADALLRLYAPPVAGASHHAASSQRCGEA